MFLLIIFAYYVKYIMHKIRAVSSEETALMKNSKAMQVCNICHENHINLRYFPLSSPLVIFWAIPSSTSRLILLQMLPVLPS